MKRTLSVLLLLAASLFGLAGCKSDCGAYCERYQECVEDDMNVSACTNTCQEESDRSRDHEAKVKECADCVGSRTCAQTFDDCIDDCFGVRGP